MCIITDKLGRISIFFVFFCVFLRGLKNGYMTQTHLVHVFHIPYLPPPPKKASKGVLFKKKKCPKKCPFSWHESSF